MLGSDPELFLRNDQGYVSAIGLIGGTKEHPRPVKELGKGFAIQEDNVLLEFNTPPSRSMNAWVKNHTVMLEYLNKYLETKGLKFSVDAAVSMPKEQLMDPRAHVFGCEPDFNVWTLKPNPKPRSNDPFLRSAGGHVHVAYKGSNVEKIILGRKLDLFLGTWSVFKDKDRLRKELYGKAGAIRFKPYGIEYRVLSNFWLKDEHSISMVWDLVERAKKYRAEPPSTVQEAIDSGDVEKCQLFFTGTRTRF